MPIITVTHSLREPSNFLVLSEFQTKKNINFAKNHGKNINFVKNHGTEKFMFLLRKGKYSVFYK